jgi:hypothetical protein
MNFILSRHLARGSLQVICLCLVFFPPAFGSTGGGMSHLPKLVGTRVSSETSFVSKQPKLEPKLVSALSETSCLFWLFRFNIETGSFGVLKQLKQTKDKLKQQQIC